MDSYGIKWIMVHVTWDYFQNHLLEVGLTTIDSLCFILCEDPTWMGIHWSSIWLRVRLHVTSYYTWGHWPHYMVLDGLWTIFLGSHNFMVMVLGTCVKWPLVVCEGVWTHTSNAKSLTSQYSACTRPSWIDPESLNVWWYPSYTMNHWEILWLGNHLTMKKWSYTFTTPQSH